MITKLLLLFISVNFVRRSESPVCFATSMSLNIFSRSSFARDRIINSCSLRLSFSVSRSLRFLLLVAIRSLLASFCTFATSVINLSCDALSSVTCCSIKVFISLLCFSWISLIFWRLIVSCFILSIVVCSAAILSVRAFVAALFAAFAAGSAAACLFCFNASIILSILCWFCEFIWVIAVVIASIAFPIGSKFGACTVIAPVVCVTSPCLISVFGICLTTSATTAVASAASSVLAVAALSLTNLANCSFNWVTSCTNCSVLLVAVPNFVFASSSFSITACCAASRLASASLICFNSSSNDLVCAAVKLANLACKSEFCCANFASTPAENVANCALNSCNITAVTIFLIGLSSPSFVNSPNNSSLNFASSAVNSSFVSPGVILAFSAVICFCKSAKPAKFNVVNVAIYIKNWFTCSCAAFAFRSASSFAFLSASSFAFLSASSCVMLAASLVGNVVVWAVVAVEVHFLFNSSNNLVFDNSKSYLSLSLSEADING